ncbi:MAG: hypothetical protein MJA82_01815, partial [Clostridia bacterium]|nr:hypothetical protein [Clostridia bacterium]
LEEICAAIGGSKQAECTVVSASVHHLGTKTIEEALDRLCFTTRKPYAKYLDLVLGSGRIYTMYDTGTNFTMVTTKLPK